MAVTTSKLPQAIDYLVTTFTAAATIGAAGITVYDGPVTSQATPHQILWVGMEDPLTGEGDSSPGSSEQEWVGPGSRWKNETLIVNCVAEAWSGETTVKTLRDQCYAIASAAETIVHDNADFGGLLAPGHANLTAGELRQAQTDVGMDVRLMFQIVCTEVRIGG